MSKSGKKGQSRSVREPIQVYLNPDERGVLDRLAGETGLSRAEILRRGLRRFAAEASGAGSPMLAFADALADADFPADMAARHDEYLANGHFADRAEPSGS